MIYEEKQAYIIYLNPVCVIIYEEEDWHCILSKKKKVWVERDLNPGLNDSDASSLWTALYKHIKSKTWAPLYPERKDSAQYEIYT